MTETAVVTTPAPSPSGNGVGSALRPLVYDLALPVAAYYLVTAGLGRGLVTGFIVSGIVSFARLVYTAVRERELNAMSLLILVVNAASIGLSFASGNVRVVSGKDAVISSVVGFGMLISALRGRPVLAEALRPFVTRGRPAAEAAWQRLADESPAFRHVLRVHSAIFGAAFVADCAVRVGCAIAAPVAVLGWIGTVATVGAMLIGAIVGGGYAVDRLQKQLAAEIARPLRAADAQREDAR